MDPVCWPKWVPSFDQHTPEQLKNIRNPMRLKSPIIRNDRKLTRCLAHAIDLEYRNVEACEKVERVAHDRRCSCHAHSASIESEGLTHFAKHQRIRDRPTPWHGRSPVTTRHKA